MNANLSENSTFHSFVSVYSKPLILPTECKLTKISENEWLFELYDLENGYQNNAVCFSFFSL